MSFVDPRGRSPAKARAGARGPSISRCDCYMEYHDLRRKTGLWMNRAIIRRTHPWVFRNVPRFLAAHRQHMLFLPEVPITADVVHAPLGPTRVSCTILLRARVSELQHTHTHTHTHTHAHCPSIFPRLSFSLSLSLCLSLPPPPPFSLRPPAFRAKKGHTHPRPKP
jgi:hypothetical protein